jgi:hypothetical protein
MELNTRDRVSRKLKIGSPLSVFLAVNLIVSAIFNIRLECLFIFGGRGDDEDEATTAK